MNVLNDLFSKLSIFSVSSLFSLSSLISFSFYNRSKETPLSPWVYKKKSFAIYDILESSSVISFLVYLILLISIAYEVKCSSYRSLSISIGGPSSSSSSSSSGTSLSLSFSSTSFYYIYLFL